MTGRTYISKNIYSSSCLQTLEQQYCSSCSAAVVSSCLASSQGFGARVMSRIYDGGRKVVYTAAIGAMLANNMAVPAHAAPSVLTVEAGEEYQDLLLPDMYEEVDVYGTTNRTQIYNGGKEIIFDGGVANDAGVYSSGLQIISQGGEANNTVLGAGGSQIVAAGASANGTNIKDDGELIVSAGGSAVGIVQEIGGGIQVDVAGGEATYITGTNVSGTFSLQDGVTNNFIIYDNVQEVFNHGITNNTTISAGGSQIISEGGITNDTVVQNEGFQIISGGIANNTQIFNGGYQDVFASGSAIGTIVNGIASQTIREGGVASNTVINEGGIQWVEDGGVDDSATVYAEGRQLVTQGGSANGARVDGGYQYLWNGGVVNDTTVQNGGTQEVGEGGVAYTTVMSNGIIELASGGIIKEFAATNGELNIYGDNTLWSNINLAHTTVNFDPHQTVGSNQTVSMEKLSASNATFNMRVDLENQTGDNLSIISAYQGNSVLNVTNIAASAQETTEDGIKLVEFQDGAEVNGTFSLAGGLWDEGGYTYLLEQGTAAGEGQDYYLRSGELSEIFKTMLNMPVMNVMLAQTGMNSLQRRLGDLRNMDDTGKHQGIWVRSYYKDLTVKDLIKTDMSLFGAEAGYDWLFRAEEPTKLYAGVMVGFVNADSIKTKKNNGMYEKGEGTSPSIGVYATLLNEEGWFVDLAARNFWTKLDMKNHSSTGTELAYKPERNIVAASVEVGKEFEKELSRREYLRIEPKLELGYMNAESGRAEVKNGMGDLRYDTANHVNAKAGVLLSYNKLRDNGLLIEPLIELAYRQEFAGTDKINYGGAEEKSKLRGGTFEVNAGLNMELAQGLYWYGLGSYEASNKVSGWGVHAGIRYKFGKDNQIEQ